MLEDLKKSLKNDLHLQVTVWDPDDDAVEHTFTSYIMEHAGNMFRFAPPMANAKVITPLIRKDFLVGVVVETYPSPFIFYPIVSDEPANPSQGYWVTIPPNAEVEVFQRRKHVRIPMVVPFELEIPYGQGEKTITLPARTCDVSGGGMRFTCVRSFPKEQEMTIYLQFHEEQPKMRLKAKVVFSAENRVRKFSDDLFATACEFIELDDAEEMILVRECFHCELKQKGKPTGEK